jgi:hypothetical protein
LAAALALASALASCDTTEEDTPQLATERPTASAKQSANPNRTATPITTATPATTAPPIPDGWQSYADLSMGFGFRYPPDLTHTDTRPMQRQRVLVFRSSENPTRGFAISISSNAEGLDPEDWLFEKAACLPQTMDQGTVDGQPAAFCTSQPEETPEAAVAVQSTDSMFFITSTLPASEFELVMTSLEL